MKYDIVENDIKIGRYVFFNVDKDIIKLIHYLEQENEKMREEIKQRKEIGKEIYTEINKLTLTYAAAKSKLDLLEEEIQYFNDYLKQKLLNSRNPLYIEVLNEFDKIFEINNKMN